MTNLNSISIASEKKFNWMYVCPLFFLIYLLDSYVNSGEGTLFFIVLTIFMVAYFALKRYGWSLECDDNEMKITTMFYRKQIIFVQSIKKWNLEFGTTRKRDKYKPSERIEITFNTPEEKSISIPVGCFSKQDIANLTSYLNTVILDQSSSS